jgi:hypothetical protein
MRTNANLDGLAVRFLLDNRQRELKVVAKVASILTGTVCPECGGRNVINNSCPGDRIPIHELDVICEDGCNDGDPMSVFTAAESLLAEIGVELQ